MSCARLHLAAERRPAQHVLAIAVMHEVRQVRVAAGELLDGDGAVRAELVVEVRRRARRGRAPRRRAPPWASSIELTTVPREDALRDDHLVDLVGAVVDARAALVDVVVREHGVARDAERAVQLDRAVDEPQHDVGDVELDQRDLLARGVRSPCSRSSTRRGGPSGATASISARASATHACAIWRVASVLSSSILRA